MQFTVKLFPEITIKSRPVRNRMVSQLRDNLQTLLRNLDPAVRVLKEWDRITVHAPADDSLVHERMVEVLQCTPGISNFLEVLNYPWQGVEDAFEKIYVRFAERLQNSTFAVRCKRSGEHSFTSTDIERQLGGLFLNRCPTARVNLDHPDIMIRLEIRDDQLSVVLKRYEGLGGFPLGSQDAVLSLVSGGFDSTVASYLTMKRGLLTHFCFFNLGGRAHETGVKEVAAYLWTKYGASHSVKFITIPFEEVVREILEKTENSQMGVILKRMMLRAATVKAREMNICALVTGESVAQVSSQTLQNLSVIDAVTDTLVLRPLITMDKTAIIDLARKIDTEKFSEKMPEYCGVISIKPTTRAKLEKIQAEENRFNFCVLEEAIKNSRETHIGQILLEREKESLVETAEVIANGEQVIDIRHPDEEEKSPLLLKDHTVVKIPFYNLQREFRELDSSKIWLIYCDQGVMSRLHAGHLRDQGFQNVKVFCPVEIKNYVSVSGGRKKFDSEIFS